MDGFCTCRQVSYRQASPPMFTHACHCTWCQRETGGPHALNALMETDRIGILSGAPVEVHLPTQSGQGQIVLRCPACQVALWSHYAGAGRKLAFVRVGTLENPAAFPPDIHIFTTSKLPWYVLPDGTPAVPEYYRRSMFWPPESLARHRRLTEAPG